MTIGLALDDEATALCGAGNEVAVPCALGLVDDEDAAAVRISALCRSSSTKPKLRQLLKIALALLKGSA